MWNRHLGRVGREGGRERLVMTLKSNRPFSLGGSETLIRMKMWFNEDENGNCAGQHGPHGATFPGGLSESWRGWGRDTKMRWGIGGASVSPLRVHPDGTRQRLLCRAPPAPGAGSRCPPPGGPAFPSHPLSSVTMQQ